MCRKDESEMVQCRAQVRLSMLSFKELWKSQDCFVLKCFVHILLESLKGTAIGTLKYEGCVTLTVWEGWQTPSERRL